jgi:hypothetical protein
VLAHIERVCDSKSPEITEQIRNMFSKKPGDNIIINKPITVDFFSEESTINSIKNILNILESNDFQIISEKVKELF